MALRHLFPKCDLPDFRLPAEPSKAPPLARKPQSIKFRPQKPMADVVAEAVGYSHVHITASVGAGKSTKVPAELCKAYGKPVYHVVPSRLLAHDTYLYLKTQDLGVDVVEMLEPGDSKPSAGVTLTTYACLLAMLVIGRDSKEPLGNVVIYADENHESDAYTYVLGKLGPSIPGIAAYISSTATRDADTFPMRETLGEVVSKKMPKVPSRDWNPLDENLPWSIGSQTGNLLIFVDNEKSADRLVSIYNGGGASAYRLTAKMDIKLFDEAMARMRDPKSGIVVLIADYSFRQGFTFMVDTIIDSGEVRYIEDIAGVTTVKYRMAFELENYQAMGRGGRLPGENVVCWNPDYKMSKAICMLEGVEMEAAAVLFRILGYAAPVEIRSLAKFAAAKTVPADLTQAFNTFIALTAQSADVMMPLVYERPATPPTEQTTEDVLDSYSDSPVEELQDYFRQHALSESSGARPRELDSASFLEELRSIHAAASSLEWPNYYGCHGVALRDGPVPRYGSNWKEAMADILAQNHVIFSFSVDERTEMISVFLLHYNACVSRVAAANRVLRVRTSLMSLASQHPELVKKWSDWLASYVRESESLGRSLLRAVDKLRTDLMHFSSVPPDEAYELRLAEEMADKLGAIVGRARKAVDSTAIFNAVKGVIGGPEHGYPGNVNMLESASATNVGGDCLRAVVRPVRVGERYMHDLELHAKESVIWTEEEYVWALAQLLNDKGYSVSSIRRLYIPGSSVKPEKVLQILRDRGIARHRKQVAFDVKMLPRSEK